MKKRVFRAQAVVAFVSGLSIALKKLDQARSSGEDQDPYRLIKAEIEEFFDYDPEHKNLGQDDLRDLRSILEMFLELRHGADLVMLDPKTSTAH